MKIIYKGEEIDFDPTLEPGEKELDMLTPDDDNGIENNDTVEITQEELNAIKDKMESE